VQEKGIYGWAIATVVVGILGATSGVLTPFLASKSVLQSVGALGTAESISSTAAKNFAEAQKFRAADDVVGMFKIQEVEDARVTGQAISEAVNKAPKLPGLIKSSGTPNAALTGPRVVHEAKNSHRKRDNRDHYPQSTSSPQSMPSHSGYQVLHKRGRAPPSAYAYQRYAEIDTHLAALQNRLQQDVAAVSLAGITEPIYNDNGLAKVLLDGSMLQQFPSQLQDEEKHKAFAKLTALNEIFRAQDMFVTIGCDPCKDKGPAGAWTQDKFLSYCTPDGSMRNIIRAEGIHARNELRNAPVLSSKYGFTTEFLTRKAIECQNKYGFYTLGKAPTPTDAESDCVFSIPVCDCSTPKVHKLRKKKKGTVHACRAAGVPI